MPNEPLIRNISDTALWVALYRALESERADALFRDPYARELAGARGAEIEKQVGMPSWPMVVRTQVLDELIQDAVEQDGFDTVLNLACGLDTRPYRLALPARLRWVEVDLPGIIEYKSSRLKNAHAFCRLERHAVNLDDAEARRALFAKVGAAANRVLVITEGLLIYLDAEKVSALAADLHQPVAFQRWLTDIVSPRLLKMLARRYGHNLLKNEDLQFKFSPAESLDFFHTFGWTASSFRSIVDDARRLKRFEIPLAFKLLGGLTALLVPREREKMRRLSVVALLERA